MGRIADGAMDERSQRYRAFMASEIWQAIRQRQLVRHPSCPCGATTKLDVHHRSYKRFGGRETNADLRTVCRKHHQEIHRLVDGGKKLARATDQVLDRVRIGSPAPKVDDGATERKAALKARQAAARATNEQIAAEKRRKRKASRKRKAKQAVFVGQCEAIKTNGERCRGDAWGGTSFCRPHQPDAVERQGAFKERRTIAGAANRPRPIAIEQWPKRSAARRQIRRELEKALDAVLARDP